MPSPSRAINRRVISVLGAGNLGIAQAGHLAAMGHEVRLFNRTPQRLESLGTDLRIRLSGVLSLEGRLSLATDDLPAAVEGADLIFVDISAAGHGALASALLPLFQQSPKWDPLVVLQPGQTFGSLHFAHRLREAGLRKLPRLCELQTAIYTARTVAPGQSRILAMKKEVGLGVFPNNAPIGPPLAELRSLYPDLQAASSTLHTALTNLQGFVHPAICLFNLTRIERGEPFRAYREGLTKAVGACLEHADRERLALARALGIEVPSGVEWYATTYGVTAPTLVEASAKVAAYDSIMGPDSLATRLLWEDVPVGLVPMCSLGRAVGVATPTLSALLNLAVSVCGETLLSQGWSLEKLGLPGADLARIREAF
jgi:opine dehydrogenase